MNFLTRIRFLFGIIVVLIIVALLVFYLNDSMSTVHALSAELGANTTTVGVDYPGVITAQNVAEGDKVSKGETMFTVQSPQLTTAIADHYVTTAALPFSVNNTGDIVVKANVSGIVEKVDYQNGAYVPGGAVLATIDNANSLYVSGHFRLAPPDYARLKKGNAVDVTFPDNTKTEATVYSIALVQDGNVVDTVLKAKLQWPDEQNGNLRFPIGTPVEASLRLSRNTWWQQTVHLFNKLFRPEAG